MAGKGTARLAVIFDIDDTLVQTGGIEADCFPRAVRDVLGKVRLRSGWDDYEHVSDTGILREICADNGIRDPDMPAVTRRFTEILQAQLAAHPQQGAEVRGAGATLAQLAARPDISLGLATGGWEVPARLKLHHARITAPAAFASSSDAAERVAIMQTCLDRMQTPVAHVVYIGDGEWDARASAALGWSFIAVGHGLQDAGHRWVADFGSHHFRSHLEEIMTMLQGRE